MADESRNVEAAAEDAIIRTIVSDLGLTEDEERFVRGFSGRWNKVLEDMFQRASGMAALALEPISGERAIMELMRAELEERENELKATLLAGMETQERKEVVW